MKLLIVFLLFPVALAQDESQMFSAIENWLRQDSFKNNSKQLIPFYQTRSELHYDHTYIIVSLAFSLRRIKSLDPLEQVLKSEAWLFFEWMDTRLRWDDTNSKEIRDIRIDIDRIWRPDISLYNNADTNTKEMKKRTSNKRAVVQKNGGVRWFPEVALAFTCYVDMTYYPFDTHNCSLKFRSWIFDGHNLDIQLADENFYDDYHKNGEWKVLSAGWKRNAIYYACCPEPDLDLTFTFTLARSNPFYQGALLFPISAAVMLTIVAFLISPFAYTRIQLNAFLLLFFIFSLFEMFRTFPSVGRHIPIIFLVVSLFILLTSMSIVWNVIVHVFADHLKCYPVPACIQRLLSTWPIKIMGQSRHKNSFQMKVERNEPNGDPEEEVIEAHGTKTVNTWKIFLVLLDRLAFFFYVIIVVVLLIFLTR